MRILNIIIFSFLLGVGIKAQEIKVLSFKQNPMDLSASTHPRYDINNDAGALVKVLLAEPNVKFEGDIIGTPEFKANEYWVYVTAGTKFLKIKASNAIPIQVSFSDYNLSSAQSKMTYELVLSRSGRAQQQTLAISFSPSNAIVLIDGKKYPSNNGKVVAMLPVGKHDFIVAADGYESYEGAVTLRESSPSNIQTTLPKSANVDVSASIEQTQNIVDKVAEAKRLYDNKDYTAAYEIFKIEADAGNAEAQYYLGKCYYFGEGVKGDIVEAVKWYRKSADQGNAYAQYNVGVCYLHGEGVKIDASKAVKWFSKSAGQGYAYAQNNLGFCYRKGIGVKQNYTEAVKWYRKSAEQGDAFAQYNLGVCYKHGEGVAKDTIEAVKWYRKSAEQGVAIAQYNLGACFYYGDGVTIDYSKAFKWYRKAAEQDYAYALHSLGDCYRKGRGVTKDETEAVILYRKAAELGDVASTFELYQCYKEGIGVTKDETQAAIWFRKMIETGKLIYAYDLDACYYLNNGVTMDDAEAFQLNYKAAHIAYIGVGIAQYKLGVYYEQGKVITQDYAEALKWYKRAAGQGNADAKKKVETYPNW